MKATGHWKRENDGSRAADKLFIAPAGGAGPLIVHSLPLYSW